ncbi:MAG: ribosomal protein S18 acetylase RimI-like enzyme [Pseudohongiellaceae bacterium]|jgi:ribosomal protein S18 acetylase RimI-like enzyme
MISYQNHADDLSPDDLQGFFEGWPRPPSPETLLRLLRAAQHVELAREQTNGRVVGFVYAVSDGILAAYVPLLEVLPEHRGAGLGSELVRRLMAALNGLYMLDLVCDESVVPFYERLGLSRLAGMARRHPTGLDGLSDA